MYLNNKKLELIVYDFDGVMTDNKVYVDQNGKEMVQVSRADGLGVSIIKKIGIEQIIISSEKNPVVIARAKKLKIFCINSVDDKKHILLEYCNKHNFSLQNVAYVGNDINDREVINCVGYSFCPADAHESIKEIVDCVLKKCGGNGVIRELSDIFKDPLE